MSQRPGQQPVLYRYLLMMGVAALAILGMLLLLLLSVTWSNTQYVATLSEHYEPAIPSHRAPAPADEPKRRFQTPESGALRIRVDDTTNRVTSASRETTGETLLRTEVLQHLLHRNQREFLIVLTIAIFTVVVIAVMWILFRRRVLIPLQSLSRGMELLSRKDYRSVDIRDQDPFMQPVFEKYNRLVGRMQDLESAHVKRETAMRQELEMKTQSIVQQQAMIGRVDRMAAMGDMAARMSHRLRNPLTGVLLTLTNLNDEALSESHRKRLQRSIEALMRSFNELTLLLDESRQEPEPVFELSLSELVDELFYLVRHQSSIECMELHNQVNRQLSVNLPETALRHAVMKLLQNAIEVQRDSEVVYVSVSAGRVGDKLEIRVEDSGPGFEDKELEQFRYADGTARYTGRSTGISIVQRFCEGVGGNLKLFNLPAGGARACMIIPQEEKRNV